ncbi:hypothetical protein XENOCAPTIV_021583 [Xenoophorus captivus]|uniref:Carbonyl reductase 1 n=1 Tax=Xenoophorus captivus TaxID=1517983 RepID=A0ABV0R2M8_9TELE
MESLSSEGLKPLFHQLDINDLNSITTAAAFFKEKYGGVDILINNAGIAFKGPRSPEGCLQHTAGSVQHHSWFYQVSLNLPFVGSRTLNQCSPELQQRFRSEDITEDELVGLMQRFVDKAKSGEHNQDGWPDTAYGVSKTGLTV